MKRSIIFSTMVYALGKDLGLEGGLAEWQRQVAEPDGESLPAARMVARLAAFAIGPEPFEVGVHVDIASTYIARSRSRAFHAAKVADFWLACDDDVECSASTLAALIAEADVPTPRVVFLPCLLRGRPVVGVKFASGARLRGDHAPIEWAATCCFVANAAAMKLLDQTCQHLRYLDDDGVHRLALFFEMLDQGRWLTEDYSFCVRSALAGVELVALMTGLSRHADQPLTIDTLRKAPELAQ